MAPPCVGLVTFLSESEIIITIIIIISIFNC